MPARLALKAAEFFALNAAIFTAEFFALDAAVDATLDSAVDAAEFFALEAAVFAAEFFAIDAAVVFSIKSTTSEASLTHTFVTCAASGVNAITLDDPLDVVIFAKRPRRSRSLPFES